MVRLTIDDQAVVELREGVTVLQAARAVGVYIPALCAHPDLPPGPGATSSDAIYHGAGRRVEAGNDATAGVFPGCGLCVVTVNDECKLACNTIVTEGAIVRTTGEEIESQRQQAIKAILSNHPHACLLCPQNDGCDRLQCTMNIPVEERCCWKFSDCELRKIADYIGIPADTPKYVHGGLPVLTEEPLFNRDYNLCIGCTRCVRVCLDIRQALGFVERDGKTVVGSVAETLIASHCKFCTACVVLCPTGALRDKDIRAATERRQKLKVIYQPAPLPPEPWIALSADSLALVPEREGVYQLRDDQKKTIRIAGVPNLQQALQEQLNANAKARDFIWEETPLYTQRESELLQEFLHKHGRLPAGNDELGDLF